MKTSVMEVHDMLSVLSVEGVEKRIGEVPGVESVTVNHAAGSATVRYDETRLDIADIRSDVRQSGHESAAAGTTSASDEHKGHKATGAPPAMPAPKTPSTASADTEVPTSPTPETVPDPNASSAAPKPAASGGDEPPTNPAPGKS